MTSSRHSPSWVQLPAQLAPAALGLLEAAPGSIAARGGSCDGNQASVNGTRSPVGTANSPTCEVLAPRAATGVRSTSASGPAMATRVPSTRRSQGTIEP